MSDIAIRVENLGKEYRIGSHQASYRTIRETLVDAFQAPFQRAGRLLQGQASGAANLNETIWALKDISFEIKQGDVVGVIGRNGAGKSTMLKILSRITEPTTGRVELHGRVGSLLEVGTGFHPELTGRENIYLNGAILGMSRNDIERQFDEIVDFAEVEKFIDTPVKHYSSGMYLRLAFAVAAHLEPEILLVDEVLAVGDASFQKKCLGKMGDVAKQGRTVLFVSHDMTAISTLTSRSILLVDGKTAFQGSTQDTINHYLTDVSLLGHTYIDRPSEVEPKIVRVELDTSRPGNVQESGQPMRVCIDVNVPKPLRNAAISFQAVNTLGLAVLHLWILDSEQPLFRLPGHFRLVCEIPITRLYMGHYSLRIHFSSAAQKYETLDGICPFEITMSALRTGHRWVPGTCVYMEDSCWRIEETVA